MVLMREWTKDLTGFDYRERYDVQAELQLRGIEPPFRLIEDVMSFLGQRVKEMFNELMRDRERLAYARKVTLREEIEWLTVDAATRKN